MNFYSFQGTVTEINEFRIGQNAETEGCFKLFTIEGGHGETVNFVISPSTYFVDQQIVTIGDRVTGYYDGDAPVPLIYPPQYVALIIVRERNDLTVKVDYFNNQLVSRDGQLQVNLSPYIPILLKNGQPFSRNIANRNLIVIYGPSTKSIPAQTTPYKIIVWCSNGS